MPYHVSFPGLGIENLKINPEAFNIASFSVKWYGIIIMLGIMLCFFLAIRQAPRFGIKEDNIVDLTLVAYPLAFLGARLYYVGFAWHEFKNNPLSILNFRTGGLGFYGGVIGAILSIYIVARWKKLDLAKFLDFLIVYLPLGQAIGRWANFFNQEAFGNNTTLPWGMISEGTREFLAGLDKNLFPNIDPNLPVHPTFFYEFVGNMIIFAFLLYYRSRAKKAYQTIAAYFVGYGSIRFIVENLRTDPLMIAGTNIRISVLVSLIMVIGGLAYLILSTKYQNIGKENKLRLYVENTLEVGEEEEN